MYMYLVFFQIRRAVKKAATQIRFQGDAIFFVLELNFCYIFQKTQKKGKPVEAKDRETEVSQPILEKSVPSFTDPKVYTILTQMPHTRGGERYG